MTLDEARLMANVNDRARRLFEDGYRARWKAAERLEVCNGRGTVYAVDMRAQACDCPFYRAHRGRRSCKHCLGAAAYAAARLPPSGGAPAAPGVGRPGRRKLCPHPGGPRA